MAAAHKLETSSHEWRFAKERVLDLGLSPLTLGLAQDWLSVTCGLFGVVEAKRLDSSDWALRACVFMLRVGNGLREPSDCKLVETYLSEQG